MFVIYFLIFSSICIDLNIFHPAIFYTIAFNIDEEYPIVIVNKFHGKTAHFGASVVLLPANNETQHDKSDITGWVIIGAPKANSTEANKTDLFEPGVIWRCSLGPNKNSEICQTVEMDPTGNDVIIDPNLPLQDRKDGGWLGGSMYVGESDHFVTCASRWINQRYNNQYLLNGMCYWLPKSHLTAIQTNSSWPWLSPNRSYRLSPLLARNKQTYRTTSLNKSITDWAYGQFGFSLHLTPNNEMIVGAVGVLDWAGTVVQYKSTPQPRHQFQRYNSSASEFTEVVVARAQNHTHIESSEYFGYSVTSGKFFKPEVSQNRTQFASGAPRSGQLSGKVVVFSMKEVELGHSNGVVDILVEPIEGSETNKGNHYGSYFGSSLLALDVSGDGFDDLLVGAPLYGTFLRTKRNAFFPTATAKNLSENNGEHVEEDVESEKGTKMRSGDEGCVFIYFSNGEDFNRSAKEICGDKISGARFGSALTSLKDINSDGFNDVAVGAPYENDGRGAVYIYHGGKEYLSLAQKLQPEYIDTKIRTFGWSLSLGADIDANGYPDLAVGAYESNHVVIYRTIPIVKFTARLTASIPKLLLTTQEFNLTTCISYTGKGLQSFIGIMVKLTVETEPDAKRLVSFVPGDLTIETPLNLDNKVEQMGPSLLAMRALILSRKQLLYFLNKDTNSKDSCYNFTLVRIGSVDDGLTRFIPIRLDYWIDGYDNVVGDSKPIYYEIQKEANTNYPVVNLTSKSDFKDFSEKKLPMTADNMFGTEKLMLPVASICEADKCLANLTLDAWLADYSKQQEIFNEEHPFLLGSADVLTLEVELANYREIANLPIVIGLNWTHPPTVRRLPSNCEQIGNTSVSKGNSYQCKLSRPIKAIQKEILSVELDMSGVFGEPEDQIFDVYLNANTSSLLDQMPEHCLSVTFKTQMNPQNFSHEPSKIEYAGNSSVPTFGIPQAFEIGLDGPSSAAALLIEFDIPHKIQVHGKFIELFGVKRPNVAYDGKMNCSATNGLFYDELPAPKVLPTNLNDTSEPVESDQQTQMTSQEMTEHGTNTDSDAPTNFRGKMKQMASSFYNNFLWTTTPKDRPFEGDYESDGEVLKITCTSKHVSCLRVSCIANHFTPTKKAVVEFKLRMFNSVAGILLNQSHHDDHIGAVWIESVGIVRTLDSNGNPFGEIGQLYLKSRLVIPPPYELPAWILIVSVAGGFLLFTIVTMILMKCGFFRRSKRDKLERMRLNKAMETHYGKMTNLNLSASSSSTARASASSSRNSTVKFNKSKKIDQFDLQSGGSIIGVTCNSPGTLVKQRQGTVDLTELRRLYASLDQNELY